MSRINARRSGQRYYMGNACNHGHIGKRYVSTGKCIDCEADKSKREQVLMAEARERGPMTRMNALKFRHKYFVADITDEWTCKVLGDNGCRHDIVRNTSTPWNCRVCSDIERRAKLRKGKPGAKVVLDPLDL